MPASMSPIPPDPPQECLKVVGISAAVATQFTEAHQLITIEDIIFFRLSESQDLMKIYNRQNPAKPTSLVWMSIRK